MTAEPSPRPWQVRYGDTVADATGAKVAACLRPENAALIVDAVNERDRLRDIVRRLADNLANYHLVGERERALLREARAAIGGEKQ